MSTAFHVKDNVHHIHGQVVIIGGWTYYKNKFNIFVSEEYDLIYSIKPLFMRIWKHFWGMQSK
jgi:hypothetical protein